MIYFKKVSSQDKRFQNKAISISNVDGSITNIPVPNNTVLCDGCNCNMYPEDVYLVYLSKNDLKADRPYDCYCFADAVKYFPKYNMV